MHGLDLEAGGSLNLEAITVTGGMTWTGGSIYDSLTLPAGSISTVSGADPKSLGDSTGDGISSAGSLAFGGSGQLTLGAPTVIDSTGALTLDPGFTIAGASCCLNPARLVSSGSLSMTGPGTATVHSVSFEVAGAVSLAGAGVVDVTGGRAQLAPAAHVTGSGRLRYTGTGDLVLGKTLVLDPDATLELGDSADLAGTGTVSGGGTLDWTGGRVIGTVTVAKGSHLVIEGSTDKILAKDGGKGQLTSSGTTDLAGVGRLLVGPQALFTDGGTMTLHAGSAIRGTSCCINPGVVKVKGTLLADAAGGTATIAQLAFSTSGTLDVHAGTLEIDGVSPTQTGGTTVLSGGTLAADHPYQLQKGKLAGDGTLATSLVSTASTVTPGALKPGHSIGTLTVTGTYGQGASASLAVDVASASSFDRLSVGGAATLGGDARAVDREEARPALRRAPRLPRRRLPQRDVRHDHGRRPPDRRQLDGGLPAGRRGARRAVGRAHVARALGWRHAAPSRPGPRGVSDLGHELQLGLFVPPVAEAHLAVLALARRADELELDVLAIQDHPYQPRFLDTWTLLSNVAARDRARPARPRRREPAAPPPGHHRPQRGEPRHPERRPRRARPRRRRLLGRDRGERRPAPHAGRGRRRARGGDRRHPRAVVRRARRLGEGDHYRLHGAHPGPRAPHRIGIWLGAYKPRMLRLTARLADGWLRASPTRRRRARADGRRHRRRRRGGRARPGREPALGQHRRKLSRPATASWPARPQCGSSASPASPSSKA